MFVRVSGGVLGGILLFLCGFAAHSQDAAAPASELRTLYDLDPTTNSRLLAAGSSTDLLTFDIAPNAAPASARLALAVRGAAQGDGELTLVVNGRRAGELTVSAVDNTVFEIDGGLLRAGANTISVMAASGDGDWLLDGRRSRLQVQFADLGQPETLADVELALASDFGGLRRIAIEDTRGPRAIEVLSAQAIALRAGRVPLFTHDRANADLVVVFESTPNAELSGPEVSLVDDHGLQIRIRGRNATETEAAARLFAARSFEGLGARFTIAEALAAPRLRRAGLSAIGSDGTGLSRFVRESLPFGADRGARTAVVLDEFEGDTRLAAFSILSRAALTTGEAWIYAAFREDSRAVHDGQHLVVIGPDITEDRAFMDRVPDEMRAALRAADRAVGRRSGFRLAASAYAEAESGEAQQGDPSGVAAVFEDPSEAGRWIAAFTAPDNTSFADAAATLARSDLWLSLQGRAAFWTAAGITPFDFTPAPTPSLRERAGELNFYPREFAMAFFTLALLFVMRGMWLRRRRRVHAMSKASR